MLGIFTVVQHKSVRELDFSRAVTHITLSAFVVRSLHHINRNTLVLNITLLKEECRVLS